MSICTLADCIKNDDDYDLNENLEPHQILEVLQRVGCNIYRVADFRGKNYQQLQELNMSMKRVILAYVQENCGCIL